MEKRVNFHGNYGYEGWKTGIATQGFGKQQHITATGHISYAGNPDKPAIIAADSILMFKMDQGLWFQAVGCDMDVEFTLENVAYATDKSANKQNLIHWCNKVTIPKNTVIESPFFGFSAIKVTFKGTGIFYAVGR